MREEQYDPQAKNYFFIRHYGDRKVYNAEGISAAYR